MTTANGRTADYPIDPRFLERWSPRAFTAEPISATDLLTILEAARWAPSSHNSQPWRFVYARRETPFWEKLFRLLAPPNQSWAKDAAALVILISNSVMRRPGSDQNVPSSTHSLDAGTASGFFALQANEMGWYVHAMVGFDRERAFAELNVPKGYALEVAYAIGRRGDPSKLPDALRAREQPSERMPLSQLAFEGAFATTAEER